VVVYGGPISYAFDEAPVDLAECIRVTRPGGVVLGRVMSTIGSFRWFLPGVAEEIKAFGIGLWTPCSAPAADLCSSA
jgi:hypothetical protein